MKVYFFLLLLFLNVPLHAIDFYSPGDTLYVWAEGGLRMRTAPGLKADKICTIPDGAALVAMENWYNLVDSFSITIFEPNGDQPGFDLEGFWVQVRYKDQIGYVFDGYLSHMQTMPLFDGLLDDTLDCHVEYLRKNHKLVHKVGTNQWIDEEKYVLYLFDSGHQVQISGHKAWDKHVVFSGWLSLAEGYLIFVRTISDQPYQLLEAGPDYLLFELEMGSVLIKRAAGYLIYFEQHDPC
jgi:hypothetical protein